MNLEVDPDQSDITKGLYKIHTKWFTKPVSLIRSGVTIFTVAYLFTVIPLFGLMGLIGERFWAFSLLLYIPTYFFVIPILITFPLSLLARPYISFLQLTFIISFFLFFWEFNGSVKHQEKPMISIVSNNIARGDAEKLRSFIQIEKPDIVVLQESGRSRLFPMYKNQYPDYNISKVREFVLLSKYPVIQTEPIRLPYGNQIGRPIAAKFTVQFNEAKIAIYNVHLVSPRPEILLISEIFNPSNLLSAGFQNLANKLLGYQDATRNRIHMTHTFVEILQNEEMPFFAIGDFNISDFGYLYRLLCQPMTDSFRKKGHGLGTTFPGYSNNRLLTYFCPWLRLDYIFCSQHFQPIHFRNERGRNSQHLAIGAKFLLQ